MDEWAPRLNEVDEYVTVNVRDVCSRCFLKVNWVAMDRLEGTNGGVDSSYEMLDCHVVHAVGFCSVHCNTSVKPTVLGNLPCMIGYNDVSARSIE